MPDAPFDAKVAHRWFAADLFNETWSWLDKPDRTPDESARMVHCAHGSRYHWEHVGDAQNLAVGEWQLARVYATLGLGTPAVHYAQVSLRRCQEHELGPFLTGSSHEVLARAWVAAGELDAARAQLALAREFRAQLSDEEEIERLDEDINETTAGL